MGLGTDSLLDTLVHHNLMHSLPRVFNGRLDIERQDVEAARLPDKSIDPSAGWSVTYLGLEVDLWPRSGAEIRGVEVTTDSTTHIAVINQPVGDILKTDRAYGYGASALPARYFNITAVLIDSQQSQTRLELEVIKP